MDCFEPIGPLSPFIYGVDHIKHGIHSAFSRNSSLLQRISALPEICLGIVELIPIFNFIPMEIEYTVKNLTIKGRIHQRELSINNMLLSPSHTIKLLYHDTAPSIHATKETYKFRSFAGSFLDIQIESLIQQLRAHPTTKKNKKFFKESIRKLEDAKQLAMLLTCEEQSMLGKFHNHKYSRMFTKIIIDRLAKLPQGNSFLVPLHTTRHAILMEWKKTEKGFDIITYNTGLGISEHLPSKINISPEFQNTSCSDLDIHKLRRNEYKNIVFPMAHTDIPISQAETICHAYFEKERNHPTNFHATELYSMLDSFGTRNIKHKSLMPYNEQSNTGTCSRKCLLTWLHQQFRSLSNGEKVYWDFRIATTHSLIKQARKISLKFSHTQTASPFKKSATQLLFGTEETINQTAITPLIQTANKVLAKRRLRHSSPPPKKINSTFFT